jgi:hypothetical protein
MSKITAKKSKLQPEGQKYFAFEIFFVILHFDFSLLPFWDSMGDFHPDWLGKTEKIG